ncbi:Ctr copper transporter family-domain-containing protein [Pholiota molesta]|nr:Ctr copper transporter family-domain-containing protein [Pholiota molesta]
MSLANMSSSADMPMESSQVMMMTPYLHFTGGDYLFLGVWRPSSPGAIAGVCIGLAVLAFFDRWLSATRTMLETYWRRSKETNYPPFVAAHDIPRGILFALQMAVMYLLMLAIMTFQAAFLISIILGLGLGEVAFGRIAAGRRH